jgi:putative chitinase
MASFQNSFTRPVHAPPDGLTSSAPEIVAEAISTPVTRLPWLARAIQAAAPHAKIEVWVAALEPQLVASGIDTPKRVAALLGQAAVEAGPSFDNLAEDTCYRTAERLCEIFPSSFPNLLVAQKYVGDDRRIACRAYAGRLGNGDGASEDGWRFRGSGLLQLTGREQYEKFAADLRAPVDQVADWIRKPDGAAASACWFWRHESLNALADAWNLAEITKRVTGSAGSDRNGYPKRVNAAEAARKAAEAF